MRVSLLLNVSPRLCIKPTQLIRMDQHIASLLLATLSPDAATRSQAEAGLNDAQNHGGSSKLFTRISNRHRNTEIYLPGHAEAGLSLARICLAAQDADIALRQSAGINLKYYVKTRWSIAFEGFKGNPPDLAVRLDPSMSSHASSSHASWLPSARPKIRYDRPCFLDYRIKTARSA